MRWGATEDMSSVQECAMQASLWMNKGRASLGEGPEGKRGGGNTHPFGLEVEGARARGCDDSSVAIFSHESPYRQEERHAPPDAASVLQNIYN